MSNLQVKQIPELLNLVSLIAEQRQDVFIGYKLLVVSNSLYSGVTYGETISGSTLRLQLRFARRIARLWLVS